MERRDGSFYLVGSRLPLALIVHEFKNGESPEAIRTHYSTLSLEQVDCAINFYLGNKEEVGRDLAERWRVEDIQASVVGGAPREETNVAVTGLALLDG